MIRDCGLLLRPALLPVAAAIALMLAAAPTWAQSSDRGYLPPPNDQAPRSIKPPPPGSNDNPGYGQPYSAPPVPEYRSGSEQNLDRAGPSSRPGTYSSDEILDTGHHFFGEVSQGLAQVVEYAFRRNGRPNGYILGEEGSGAVIAGLRYGEGVLHTKGFPPQKVYWQGPSVGYDFGANGSKTLTLVYNIQYPSQIYERFGGIDGSAYFVGGAGITFQQHDDMVLAPIRAGVGLRLGANVGYLKYTPSPTWNPF